MHNAERNTALRNCSSIGNLAALEHAQSFHEDRIKYTVR